MIVPYKVDLSGLKLIKINLGFSFKKVHSLIRKIDKTLSNNRFEKCFRTPWEPISPMQAYCVRKSKPSSYITNIENNFDVDLIWSCPYRGRDLQGK